MKRYGIHQRKLKRRIALLLTCALCLTLLCGCGLFAEQVVEVPDEVKIPPQTKPPETKAPETEPPETDAPETDAPETDPPETEPPAPEDPVAVRTEELLAEMTVEQKVAQLFFVTPESLLENYYGVVEETGPMMTEAFASWPVGGIIYMYPNLDDPAQTRRMLGGMQECSLEQLGLPVFLGVDEEGGSVARISGQPAFGVGPYPDMAEIGAEGDSARARQIGEEMGEYLSELGFNVDFAPVADVLIHPDNTVVRDRSFGSDPQLVTEMCAAFAAGIRSEGVLCCYKHFPGHGATAQDSHDGAAGSDRTKAELLEAELLPFADAAQRGVPFIMSGHITVPAVTKEDVPASLSSELLTGLLRGELGYEGIIITDALNMGAIANDYEPGEAAVLAIEAGNDMLMLAGSFFESYDAVLAAVNKGRISEARLNASVYRIVYAKLSWQAMYGQDPTMGP